ncbi:MAG: tetratricopeptide repeat protein [Anaerolineae bacterium]|nr:tetratricopeptide repeat protein [Anaerolineae bacterium]
MKFGQVSEEHIKIAELSRKIGVILVERGDYEQAMHQFQLGLQYLGGIEHKEVARIYNEIGRVYWHQGALDRAQEWTEKAFDLAERLLDPDEVARFLYYAGIRYRRQGSNKLAEEHWLRSLEISKETGDLAMQGRLYQDLGWQSEEMGNYRQALERLEKGRELADLCGDISTLSVIYETMGETYYVLGEWDKAIEHLQQSLNLAEQAGLRKATSRVFSVLGDIYRNQGRWTEADECYQRALSSITATGMAQSPFVIHLSLGLINMDRGRYDIAQEYFDKCWAICSEGVGFTNRMAIVKAHMGEVAVLTGDLDKAEAQVAQAIEFANEADGHRELAYAMLVKGLVASRRRNWEEATTCLADAVERFEMLEAKYDLACTYAEMGKMYRSRKADGQDRELAETYLGKAKAIFETLGAHKDLEKLAES